MSLFWIVPGVLAAVLTILPLVTLDAGSAFRDLVFNHAAFVATIGSLWAAVGSWVVRRIAEFALLARSGAKLKTDA